MWAGCEGVGVQYHDEFVFVLSQFEQILYQTQYCCLHFMCLIVKLTVLPLILKLCEYKSFGQWQFSLNSKTFEDRTLFELYYLLFFQEKLNFFLSMHYALAKRRSPSLPTLKPNFHKYYNNDIGCKICGLGTIDSQEHLIKCHRITSQLPTEIYSMRKIVKYKDIFGTQQK